MSNKSKKSNKSNRPFLNPGAFMSKINHILIVSVFCFICFSFKSAAHAEAEPVITGFWKTIDDKTGKPQSLIAIYSKDDKYYGRIVLTYNDDGSFGDDLYHPKDRAPGVIGNPFYAGMDIIWAMEKDGSKYKDGKIIDPQKGDVYDAEMWPNKGNLIVRGEILFLGENQTWLPAKESDFPPDFKKPDYNQFTPVKPSVKH